MRSDDLGSVAGDADEADESLLPSLDRRLQRAAGAERSVLLNRIREVVELPQVDVVDPQALQRPLQLLASRRGLPFAALGGQKELPRVAAKPRSEAQLRLPIAGSNVDVVDSVREQHIQRLIGDCLRDA